MNPLSRIKLWWHQPVLDRLDAIERNTRPASVLTRHTENQKRVADVQRAVTNALRATSTASKGARP